MTVRRWFLALAAALALALLPAAPAAAHASLENSTPAANAVLTEPPPLVLLDFDEEIETALASIELFDGTGAAVPLGEPQKGTDGTQVRVAVPSLEDGLFAVVWRVTSVDGHVVQGSFAFQVGTADAGDADALLASVGGGRGSTSLEWRYGVARFLSLAGLVLWAGLGWWLMQRPAFLLAQRRLQRVLAAGAGMFVVGSVGAFVFFAAQVSDGELGSAVSPAAWADATRTTTGLMLLARVVVSVGAAALTVGVVRQVAAPAGRMRVVAPLAAAAAVLTFSASGHPNAVAPRLAWVAVDAVHLAAVVAWLGGLVALTLADRESRRTPEVQGLALRFSGVATVAVPALVLTGVAQTWRLADGFADVTATTWGRLLLVKVTIIAALLAVAGVSRWLLHREGVASIGRTLVVETVAAVAVLGLVAAMVAQPPRPALATRPYEGTLTASGLIASLSISPGRVGANEVHILVTPPGGSILPVLGATARVSLPSADIPAAPATLLTEGANHFSGVVSFTQPGEWTFEIIVQISESETALLKATVPIP